MKVNKKKIYFIMLIINVDLTANLNNSYCINKLLFNFNYIF